MSSESASVNLRVTWEQGYRLKVILCYAVLYYNVGTGTAIAGQNMAGLFFFSRLGQLGAIYAHLMRILVPGLILGRLYLYIVVIM